MNKVDPASPDRHVGRPLRKFFGLASCGNTTLDPGEQCDSGLLDGPVRELASPIAGVRRRSAATAS